MSSELERDESSRVVIVAATGFKKDYSMFSKKVRDKLDIQSDGLWLYKNVVPAPLESAIDEYELIISGGDIGLAFVGSEA